MEEVKKGYQITARINHISYDKDIERCISKNRIHLCPLIPFELLTLALALVLAYNPFMLVRKIKSRDLFGSAQSILIEHEGSTYCLRATKFGKLLITK